MGKLKDQLAGIAALIAAVVAIGGGFTKYGELTTRLNEIENKSSIDHSSQIAVLEEKVAALENKKEVDVSGIDTRSKINEKSIKLLELKIEELKAAANPLGG
tara:strand:+ start:184 stop:489 length:306 start_codon:yes stop_codon:yes gene_type:complete